MATCINVASRSIAPTRRSSIQRTPLRVSAVAQTPAPSGPRVFLPTPKGVSLPARLPSKEPLTFGFVDFAEKVNSRACMLGFIGTLIVEAVIHKGVLEAVGIRVGNGLGFEF